MLLGRIGRGDKPELLNISRSSVHLNAVSNRLASSSPRARFLGMVYGTAISDLVDPKEKRMRFSAEEIDSADGLWYRSLTSIHDKVGSIADLELEHEKAAKPTVTINPAKARPSSTAKPAKVANMTSKIVSIEELDNSSESEDEDLPSYQKPDSDPEDEDEDPTLVQRDRPTAPV